MKVSEFRSMIREEVRKTLNEYPEPVPGKKTETAKRLGFSTDKVKTYAIGTGKRRGMPIDPSKLRAELSKQAESNLKLLEKSGITFNDAYVNVTTLSDWGKPKEVLTYTFFGTDSKGNEIAYDKYESGAVNSTPESPGTVGGGQSFVFINGKKQNANSYIRNNPNTGVPIWGEVHKFFDTIVPMPDWKWNSSDNDGRYTKFDDERVASSWHNDWQSDVTAADEAGVRKIFNTLKANKQKIASFLRDNNMQLPLYIYLAQNQKWDDASKSWVTRKYAVEIIMTSKKSTKYIPPVIEKIVIE